MIEVENLGKTYDTRRALDGFSLKVAEGELFGLVGPNGAGKTTLIKILATLLVPTSGSVRIQGTEIQADRDAVKQKVGYMPDQPGLYQEMRIREFLQFFADAFHLNRDRRNTAIELALIRSGLGDRQDSYVEELSFGLKQRLMLAKTLLHSPRILLLDEPATGLDPIARLELRRQLKALNAEGITILISSHILADLEDICSRVALISNGTNTADEEGNNVIRLAQTADAQMYEIGMIGSVESARAAAERLPGTTVVKAEGATMLVELRGGDSEAAALLRSLVVAQVEVVRFIRRSESLEERYQKAFGGLKP